MHIRLAHCCNNDDPDLPRERANVRCIRTHTCTHARTHARKHMRVRLKESVSGGNDAAILAYGITAVAAVCHFIRQSIHEKKFFFSLVNKTSCEN